MNKHGWILSVLLSSTLTALADGTKTLDNKREITLPYVTLSDTSHVRSLEEVIVISQPKEACRVLCQTIKKSDEIERLGVRDLRELSAYIPSFVMPNYGSRLTSSIYIRGIGSRINNPAVGIYVDGMPLMSKSAFNFHTYDLEGITVARGPQGTLYGQNTEGGLVQMYTRNPMDYQGTDVKLGWGTRFYRNAEVSHYNKVNDKLAFSLAGFYEGQNGFFKNQTTGGRADLYNEAGGKLKIVFRPNEKMDFSYVADYQYVRQNAFPYGIMGEQGQTAPPSTNYQSNYRRNMFNTALNMKIAGNGFDFFSTTSYQYLKDYMLMDQDYLPQDYMHLIQRQFQNAMTQEFVFRSNNRSSWHWITGAFFSSQWLKTNAPVYFGESVTNPISRGITHAMYNAMVNSMKGRFIQQGMTEEQAIEAAKAAIEKAGGIKLDVQMQVPGNFRTPQSNLAFYHESRIDITPRLSAILGLRYDYNHVGIQYDTHAEMTMAAHVMGQQATNVLSSYLNNHIHNDFNQLLPEFGIRYRLDNFGSDIYALASKGYRAGGFNIQMFSDILQTELNANSQMAMRGSYDIPHSAEDYRRIAQTIAYKPEVTWSYELGTHQKLFNNTLQFDFSAYYMQVRDQQLSVMAGNYGYGRMMVNAGKSRSCGIEASLSGNALNKHLAWSVNYGLTHAVFKEYKDSVTINGAKEVVDYQDKKVPYVPMHTFSAVADYRLDFTGCTLKSLTIGANVHAQGKTYWNEANTYSQNLYAILGAHIDANFGKVELSIYGRNLTNTRYNTFVVNSGASGQTYNFAQQGNPIQFGANLRLHL